MDGHPILIPGNVLIEQAQPFTRCDNAIEESPIPMNGWDEISQSPTDHAFDREPDDD